MNSNHLLKKADSIRKLICEMCLIADSGHPNSSLSCVDILTVLYFSAMESKTDSFILSKGHAAPALYSALMAKDLLDRKFLKELRNFNSPLQGHPDRLRLPDVGASTGALGQGLSMTMGQAIGKKKKQELGFSYCIIGDGESQEGQSWEAALFAGNREIDNLIAFCDYNKGQSDGLLEDIMSLGDLKAKWEAFNWNVIETNGHSIPEIQKAILKCKNKNDKKPSMIIAHTIKGYISKNLSILDQDHGGKMTGDTLKKVISELNL